MKNIVLTLILVAFPFLVFGQSNVSKIEQVGNLHEAQIEQEATIGDDENYNGNFPGLGQGINGAPNGQPFQNENDGVENSGSFAEILQFDTGNLASIIQNGSHWAQIYQDGFHNIANINQDGNGGNGVSFEPPGVASPCPPPFAPCDASSDDGSVASVYQEGDQNAATIEQDLGSNEAKIVQYGSDLEAIILQYGDSNFASILQDFRGNSILNGVPGFRTAEIEQYNSNNIATVEQSVPTEFPIEVIQNGNMQVHIEHH